MNMRCNTLSATVQGTKVMLAPLVFMSGCVSVDLNRAAHDGLMQYQCHKLEARGTCNRDWGEEYQAWLDARAEFERELEARAQRSGADRAGNDRKAKLPEL